MENNGLLNKISILPDDIKNNIKLYFGGGKHIEELKELFKLTNQYKSVNNILKPLGYLKDNRILTDEEYGDYWRFGFIRYEIAILEFQSTKYTDNELFPQMIDFYKKELKKLEDKINV